MKTCKPTMKLKWVKCDTTDDLPAIKATAKSDDLPGNPFFTMSCKLMQAWQCDDGSIEWHEVKFEK